MSEHTPITGELRGTMFITESEQGTPMVELGWFRFKQLCDAIDAVHANLERENDLLRRKLDRVQEEREGLIELPKDADGVPIRVMECSACGGTYEHVNGSYEFCPRCGRRVEVDG